VIGRLREPQYCSIAPCLQPGVQPSAWSSPRSANLTNRAGPPPPGNHTIRGLNTPHVALRRPLSPPSTMQSPSYSAAEGPSHPRDAPEVASRDGPEPALPGGQGEFSLEKTMREILRRLVLESPLHPPSSSPPPRLEDSGIVPNTLGVYFKDLRVVGAGASAFFQDTVGSRLNPKVAYNDIHRALRPETRDILSGFNGVIRPGEMLRKFHLRCSG
jgi:hypothetical protein